MGNFFNDLNKVVNTIQKGVKIVDKMTETPKPKRNRIKTISINFTEKELRMIYDWWIEADETLHNKCNEDIITQTQLQENIKLHEKLRNARYKF